MRNFSYQPYPTYHSINTRTQQQHSQQQQHPQQQSIPQQHQHSTHQLHQQQRPYTSLHQQQETKQQQQQQQDISLTPTQQLPTLTMSPQLQLPMYSKYQQQQQCSLQLQQQQSTSTLDRQHAEKQAHKQLNLQQQEQLSNATITANYATLQQQQQCNGAGTTGNAVTNASNGNYFVTPSPEQYMHIANYSHYSNNNIGSNNKTYSNTNTNINNNNRQQLQLQLQQSHMSFANNQNQDNPLSQFQQQQRQRELQMCNQQQHMQQLQQMHAEQQQQDQLAQQPRQYNNNDNHIHSSANNQQQMHLQQLQRHLLEKQQHKQQQQQMQIVSPTAVTSNSSSFSATPTNLPNHNGTSSNDDVGSAADCRFTMDACEIANFLANELFMHQLVSMDGMQSGVPTLTTSTLTPTTLRSIEETFIQLTTDHSNPPFQAGFIPPPVNSIPCAQNTASPAFTGTIQNYNDIDSEDSQASWTNSQLNEENSLATTDTSSAATDSTSFPNGTNGISNASLATSTTSSKNDFTLLHSAIAADAGKHANNLLLTTSSNNSNVHTSNSATNVAVTPAPTRRNQGGRRPTKSANMSPEEEEKRRIRRERNKLAAARCRKRRVDQTNELQTEVDRLEGIRETLQKEVESLKVTKNQLAFILEAHRPTCQKIRQDLLSVHTYDGLIAPANSNSNDSNSNIIGVDTTLSSVGRSGSPIDLKPIILGDNVLDMVSHIKNEPLDSALDSSSSLDHDGPSSPKRMLFSDNNSMVQPPLPNVATLSASLAAASASLNTPIVTTAPVNFASLVCGTSIIANNNNNIATSSAITGILGAPNKALLGGNKQRPNSLPTNLRNQAQNLALNTERPPTDINGVAIQTPSTGMFNFDSLMDGGTGLTPVSGPLVPTCSSQNKHPLELQTPTSEPSKLVSL